MARKTKYDKYRFAFDEYDDEVTDAIEKRSEQVIAEFVQEKNVGGLTSYSIKTNIYEAAEKLIKCYKRPHNNEEQEFQEILTLIRSAGFSVGEYEVVEKKKLITGSEQLEQVMLKTMEELATGVSAVQRLKKMEKKNGIQR